MSPSDPSTPAAPSSDEAAALVGSTIAGRYKVEGLLGEGAMGAVYLVTHTGIRKRMALKLLRPELMRNPAMLARFEREAMAAAHLDHPHVATASDFGRTEQGRFFLVLEYVSGQELRSVLERAGGPLPLARALFIAKQITTALLRAHELGIVHRDLKPENIMLVEREGHGDFVKVLDFGLAHVPVELAEEKAKKEPARNTPQLTHVGDIFGTPAYMSPEQSVGESTDGRTDLYALGIILYEMIAGVRPFTGKSLLVLMQQHLSTPPPSIAERAPSVSVPPEVETLLQRLLAKSVEARVQHPQEVLTAIDEIMVKYKLVWPGAPASPPEPVVDKQTESSQQESSVKRAWGAMQWLPHLLRKAPKWSLLLGLGVVLAVIVGLLPRRGGSPPVSKPVPPPSDGKLQKVNENPLATQADLELAISQGPAALESLSVRFPKDPRIVRALVRGLTGQQKHTEAMRALSKLALLDSQAGHDAELAQSIVAALQSEGEAAQAAVNILEQELGSLGVDLIYDLTVRQTGAKWKPRLHQSLTKPEVVALASPTMRYAIELRGAKTCEAKRDLLPRAPTEGDRRTLVLLRSLLQTQGCGLLGLQDCWPCLRKSSALTDAITAMESKFPSSP